MNFILETTEHMWMEAEGGTLTYLQMKLYSVWNLLQSHESGGYINKTGRPCAGNWQSWVRLLYTSEYF